MFSSIIRKGLLAVSFLVPNKERLKKSKTESIAETVQPSNASEFYSQKNDITL